MAYKLEANHPDFPKGWEFDCDGIPLKNGGSVAITAEMEAAFIGKNFNTIENIYGHSEIFKLSGTSELASKSKKDDSEGGDS
jgi:hypothetical protein